MTWVRMWVLSRGKGHREDRQADGAPSDTCEGAGHARRRRRALSASHRQGQRSRRSEVLAIPLRAPRQGARDGPRSLSAISLQEARARVAEYREQRHDGIDPVDARRAERKQSILDSSRAPTFKDAAEKCLAAHRAGWRNAKHAAQWESTLATYAYPVFGAHSVQAIDTTLVHKSCIASQQI